MVNSYPTNPDQDIGTGENNGPSLRSNGGLIIVIGDSGTEVARITSPTNNGYIIPVVSLKNSELLNAGQHFKKLIDIPGKAS